MDMWCVSIYVIIYISYMIIHRKIFMVVGMYSHIHTYVYVYFYVYVYVYVYVFVYVYVYVYVCVCVCVYVYVYAYAYAYVRVCICVYIYIYIYIIYIKLYIRICHAMSIPIKMFWLTVFLCEFVHCVHFHFQKQLESKPRNRVVLLKKNDNKKVSCLTKISEIIDHQQKNVVWWQSGTTVTLVAWVLE